MAVIKTLKNNFDKKSSQTLSTHIKLLKNALKKIGPVVTKTVKKRGPQRVKLVDMIKVSMDSYGIGLNNGNDEIVHRWFWDRLKQ